MIQWYKDITIQRKTLPVQHHVHVDHVDLKNKDENVKFIQRYEDTKI